MLELHYLLFKRKIPLIIAYEGWDAAGKGGNITRVTRYMNPLGYYVVPVSAPTEHEKQYHYLRRFIKHFPTGGDIAIFDRSWYGRVLVERVENFCSEPEWQRAYGEINEMEEDFINSSGGGIVKFWLEISKEEQLRRFQQRAGDPQKIYKITDEDWRNREKWDLYDEAVDEMLARTSTDYCPVDGHRVQRQVVCPGQGIKNGDHYRPEAALKKYPENHINRKNPDLSGRGMQGAGIVCHTLRARLSGSLTAYSEAHRSEFPGRVVAQQFTQSPAELLVMTGKLEEDIAHGLGELFAVHVMELAVIRARIDDHIGTFQVLYLGNLIHFFDKARWHPERDFGFITGHRFELLIQGN